MIARSGFILLTFANCLLFSLPPLIAQSLSEAKKLDSQGSALCENWKYKEAVLCFQRALNIREKNLGPEHLDTAQSNHNLAFVYELLGEYAKSLPLYERALTIREKKLGSQHPDTADSINSLGGIYLSMDEYDKAQLLYERSLNIREKVCGPQHLDTAQSLNNLAIIPFSIGDFTKALPLFERALSIKEKKLGFKHPDTADSIINLAVVYSKMGDYAKALPLSERALAIYEKTLGPQHQATAGAIRNLSGFYSNMGDYAKALPLSERALAIYEKTVGPQHPDTAYALVTLAVDYNDTGNYTKALPLFQRALAINEKYYGLQHPQSTQCIEKLAWFTYCAGDSSLTLGYATKWFAGLQKELLSMLTLDERSRLSWQLNKNVYWLACVLPPDSLAKLTLKHKGAVLESLAEDRALAMATGSFGEGANILQNIQSLKSKLSKIVFDKNNEEEASKLQDEIGSLQRELTLKYLGRERHRASASITMADIMPALAGSGVLVDVIQFYDPKLKGDEETCLGAIITGEDNNPVFVRIDGGSAINRAIDSLRAAINQGNSIEVEAKTKFLSEKLWAPIAAKIPEGTKRLFLSPDANLNFLSFAALLDSDGRFVAEKYPITYIGSARDLAKKPSGKISKSMALIANPQFDAADKNAKTNDLVAMRSAEADVFGSIALPPLPGTEAEATSLQALATESGWQTKSYLGKDATEPSVRNTKKPGVLHLATHGFYLNSFTPPGPEGSRGMSVVGVKETTEEKKKKEKGVDPMRASGVAFTGAQQTLTSWSQRKAPNPETDGVLTAEEVGALRLDGTWLVVLSACETGVGEARSGEGVFGLRRAFMIAGAENLLMTLWPVADETTAKIMTDFYKEAFATGDAHGSLAKVQRDWLVKLRQERGLLAAVREAGPFAMVTMTNPNAQREFVEGQLEVAPEKAAIPKSDKILEFQVALAKADAGDAYAQAVVSIYYGLGLGCDQDFAKSKEYVMLSAKQQNPLGIYRLAEMREVGEGMDPNSDQALQLMKKAKPGLQKLSNDPYALTALATIYERENPDSPKIREVLTKASEMGYEPAQSKLTQLPTN